MFSWLSYGLERADELIELGYTIKREELKEA
jgi:hypothetical protein